MYEMKRDAKYIADQLKLLRQLRGLKQENVADLSGLSTRTIEKVESGRHSPNDQTLRSIARALDVDIAVFDKPTPEQQAAQKRELQRMVERSLLVPIYAIRSAQDFISRYGEWHRWRFDTTALKVEEALKNAAAIGDWLQDLDGLWATSSMSDRMSWAQSIWHLCQEIEKLGYVLYIGEYREQLRENGKPNLVFLTGLVLFQAISTDNTQRRALIQLEDRWEGLDESQKIDVDRWFKDAKA